MARVGEVDDRHDFFARIKSIYGTDTLLTKIASGATTGALGAFLANPVVPGREHGENHGAL